MDRITISNIGYEKLQKLPTRDNKLNPSIHWIIIIDVYCMIYLGRANIAIFYQAISTTKTILCQPPFFVVAAHEQ